MQDIDNKNVKMLPGQFKKVPGEEKIVICFGNGKLAYMKTDKNSIDEINKYNS